MSDFPKDGSTFITESIDRIAYRWAKYKPDGARQMGKPGRWQKQVWHGDYFKWENCEDPVGVFAPALGDGPISGAVNALAAKDAEIARLEEARAEQWRLRRDVEGSRDAAKAACDSMRIERDKLKEAMEGICHFSDALNFRNDHLSKALAQWIVAGRAALKDQANA